MSLFEYINVIQTAISIALGVIGVYIAYMTYRNTKK